MLRRQMRLEELQHRRLGRRPARVGGVEVMACFGQRERPGLIAGGPQRVRQELRLGARDNLVPLAVDQEKRRRTRPDVGDGIGRPLSAGVTGSWAPSTAVNTDRLRPLATAPRHWEDWPSGQEQTVCPTERFFPAPAYDAMVAMTTNGQRLLGPAIQARRCHERSGYHPDRVVTRSTLRPDRHRRRPRL